ncbi:hypothetical protein Tco_0077416 [Tanacetum coccineum]
MIGLTAASPSPVPFFDPKEDLEEDLADYPADRGDDDDGDDDEDDGGGVEGRIQRHLKTDEFALHQTHTTTFMLSTNKLQSSHDSVESESAPTPPLPRPRRARISVRPQTPMSAAAEALITAVAIVLPSSPPPYPLTPLLSPLPQIPSPPLPLPSPPLPLPAPSSPLLLPATNHKEDVPVANVPPRKKLCLTAPTPRFEVGESSTAAARQPKLDVTHATDYSFVGYGI